MADEIRQAAIETGVIGEFAVVAPGVLEIIGNQDVARISRQENDFLAGIGLLVGEHLVGRLPMGEIIVTDLQRGIVGSRRRQFQHLERIARAVRTENVDTEHEAEPGAPAFRIGDQERVNAPEQPVLQEACLEQPQLVLLALLDQPVAQDIEMLELRLQRHGTLDRLEPGARIAEPATAEPEKVQHIRLLGQRRENAVAGIDRQKEIIFPVGGDRCLDHRFKIFRHYLGIAPPTIGRDRAIARPSPC